MTKFFTFNYPLKRKVVRNLKLVTETVAELHVQVIGKVTPNTSRLDLDHITCEITTVQYEGVNIMPVLEVLGGLDDIHTAACRQVADKVYA